MQSDGLGGTVWAVDREASTAEFSVRFLTVARTSGSFGEVSGKVVFDEDDPSASYVEATIEVPSVETGNETRDEHIKEREDFFETGTFPEITFKSSRVEPAGDGALKIHGDLTIRDATGGVVLDARYGGTTTDGAGTRRLTFDAETEIERSSFGLDWGGKAARAVIGEKVSVAIHIEAVHHPTLV